MPLVGGGTQWEGYGQENINFFSWEDIERKGNKPHPTN